MRLIGRKLGSGLDDWRTSTRTNGDNCVQVTRMSLRRSWWQRLFSWVSFWR